MEPKIGKTFSLNGKTLEVVEGRYMDCNMCYFKKNSLNFCLKIMCTMRERLDGKNIYFKEVTK